MAPGVARRMRQLLREGHFRLLALDHGLTSGALPGISTIDQIDALLAVRDAPGANAVVVNAGLVARLRIPPRLSLVVQLFGSPLDGRPGSGDEVAARHVRLHSPALAARLGADAVAVQAEFRAGVLRQTAPVIAQTIEEAHDLGLPVLAMLAPPAGPSVQDLMASIRAAAEIGADIVKVAAERLSAHIEDGGLADLGAPLVLAGGPRRPDLGEVLREGARVGFSGVCMGRNVFEASPSERAQIWSLVHDQKWRAVRSIDA